MKRLAAAMTALMSPNDTATTETLAGLSVPISLDPCRGCASPCDEGHDETTSKLFIDKMSDLLGTTDALARQVGRRRFFESAV